MDTERVTLRHLDDGMPVATPLREPSGRDEISVEGVDTRAAVALLDRLLPRDGARHPPAARLAASDRDALLAALHRHLWGDTVRSNVTCRACGEGFGVSFELSALQRHLAASRAEWRPGPERAISNANGEVYRVPSADDELKSIAEGVADAAARLAGRPGAAPGDIERAAAALESGAPILDVEIEARCVGCGASQLSHFDLQSFVMQRLLDERPALLAEVHALADGYGWPLREILALTRRTRRSLAGLVADARSRAAARSQRALSP
jgi:hypothetical protein